MDDETRNESQSGERELPSGLELGDAESCLRWEAALADLLDGTLAPEQEVAFRHHAATCAYCQVLLQEATRGRDWARLLYEAPPQVPEALLGKILARTAEASTGPGGAPEAVLAEAASGFDAVGGRMALPAAGALLLPPAGWSLHGQRQARLLMTAAMAFFSIALTLSMAGLRLGDLHAAPATLGATATRQFFDTKKQVVSFYDNLRLVREMEATVEDLRNTAGTELKKAKQAERPQPSASRMLAAPLLARGAHALANKADEKVTL